MTPDEEREIAEKLHELAEDLKVVSKNLQDATTKLLETFEIYKKAAEEYKTFFYDCPSPHPIMVAPAPSSIERPTE